MTGCPPPLDGGQLRRSLITFVVVVGFFYTPPASSTPPLSLFLSGFEWQIELTFDKVLHIDFLIGHVKEGDRE